MNSEGFEEVLVMLGQGAPHVGWALPAIRNAIRHSLGNEPTGETTAALEGTAHLTRLLGLQSLQLGSQ